MPAASATASSRRRSASTGGRAGERAPSEPVTHRSTTRCVVAHHRPRHRQAAAVTVNRRDRWRRGDHPRVDSISRGTIDVQLIEVNGLRATKLAYGRHRRGRSGGSRLTCETGIDLRTGRPRRRDPTAERISTRRPTVEIRLEVVSRPLRPPPIAHETARTNGTMVATPVKDGGGGADGGRPRHERGGGHGHRGSRVTTRH